MGKGEVVFKHLLQAFTFVNSIDGVFIVVDYPSRNVSLCGNNIEIVGYEDEIVVFTFEECKKIIGNTTYDYFKEGLNSKTISLFSYEFKIVNKNKDIKWLSLHGYIKRNGDKFEGFEGYIKDVTLEKIRISREVCTYTLDEITGLHNRSYLKEKVEGYLNNIDDSTSRSALIILDLDNFKYINDSFGNRCGDIFLNEVSRGLENTISDEDAICRFGGDEFLIFLPDIKSLKQVENTAKEIINILNKSYKVEGRQVVATTSVGISIYPNDGDDFDSLVKNADAAMYIAKSNGKNQYQFFNSKISEELDKIYSVQKGLITALEKNEIYVMFQPKVTLDKNKVCGFEALIRWNSDELGHVNPLDFISIAETTGQIIPIGKFVLKEVFAKARYLIDNGYDNFRIAYNLSEVQLRDGTIIDEFKNLMEEYAIEGKYIEIEITESMLMKSFDKNNKYLLDLKDLGVTIALDDFGTGYSSLNYLTKLPIDVLKIDRSFVADIGCNHKNRWIIENIIELSHKLGITVVAEGVEVQEQVEYLKGVLCDTVQGYYYSKPETFEKAMELLSR